MKNETVKVRPIGEVAAALRKALGHTQQSWATLMGWSISSAVRFENGGKPSLRMLGQMLNQADQNGLDDLAAEVRLHFNAAMGPDSHTTPPSNIERYCVLLIRRILQNKKRIEAFLKFAAPEIAILQAEEALRQQDRAEALAEFERMKKGAKK